MSEIGFCMAIDTEKISFSVILPIYNEQECLDTLLTQLISIFSSEEQPYEIIAIDDGSSDVSFETLKRIKEKNSDSNLKIIRFRKNFGKASALSCGFEKARGDIIITMDADLQDDPAEVNQFINAIRMGSDVVIGWKYPRQDPLSKVIPSKIFNWMINRFCKVRFHDINCGYKAFRYEVIKNLDVYGGRYRFLPIFANNLGYKVTEIKINHMPRKFGHSKYGTRRFYEGLFDLTTVILLTRFQKVPLHFFGMIGLIFMLLGILFNGYLTALWFMGHAIGQRPLLMLGVLLIILGVQLIGFGLIGEMIVESKEQKLNYLILDEY